MEALLLASRPNAFDPDAAAMRRSAFAQVVSARSRSGAPVIRLHASTQVE
jgi:hypothetical protein